jgi:hypothetical protein
VQAEIPILGGHQKGSFDLGMILLALAFGSLGATAHCLYVFLGAVAGKNREFTAYRIGWFFPQPPLGAILGALLYVTARAGLLSSSSGASPINMFGVAAIAAAGGLSAPRAYQRLTTQTPTPAATPPSSNLPVITQVSPSAVTAAELPAQVTITGSNLTKASFLLNGRAIKPDSVSASNATFTIQAADAPSGHIVITLAPNVAASASVKVVSEQ